MRTQTHLIIGLGVMFLSPAFAVVPVPDFTKIVTSQSYVEDTFQEKIEHIEVGTETNDPLTNPVINYPDATDGAITRRLVTAGPDEHIVFGVPSSNTISVHKLLFTPDTSFKDFVDGTNLTKDEAAGALPTLEVLKDVVAELQTSINSLLPRGNAGYVVTYQNDGTIGGGKEVSSAATYNQQTGALTNGNNVANISAVDTRQKKKICGGYEPAAAGQPAHDGTHEGDEDYCWLWIFPD